MIIIQNEQIDNIPVLHVVEQEKLTAKLPLVIFIHGFTSAKEHNLHYAYLLAQSGFRVILPDALFHGERAHGKKEADFLYSFWDIVITTIHELEMIKDAYAEKNLIGKHIGIAGASMGACVTLGALTQYSWIAAAVSLMGSPAFVAFANAQVEHMRKSGTDLPFSDEELREQLAVLEKYDLTLHKEQLRNRPLLFWHGTEDNVVPYAFAKKFYDDVQSENSNVNFISGEQIGHKVNRQGVLQTVAFLRNHLVE